MAAGSENKRELLDLAINTPEQAVARCNEILEDRPTRESEIWARRANGVALRTLGQLDNAHVELTHALGLAAEESRDLWAGCAISLSAVMMFRGEVEEGAALLDEAIAASSGMTNAEAWLQKGTFNMAVGRHEAAFTALTTALPKVREHGRTQWEADLLNHRGVVQIFEGRSRAALTDFNKSIALADPNKASLAVAMARCNKALAMFRTGDLRGSLDLFGATAAEYESFGMTVHDMAADWSEALLAAGMFDQAIEVTGAAAAHFGTTGFVWGTMQCCAIGAEAALAADRSDVVTAITQRARSTPGAAQFAGWLARAELAAIRAQMRDHSTDDLARRARETSTQLAEAGQSDAAVDAELAAIGILRELGQSGQALGELDTLGTRVASSPTVQQIEYWSLLAQLRFDNGNTGGALRAARAALDRVDLLLATCGSFEVRAHARTHSQRATDVSVAIHVEKCRLDRVVSAVEQQRSEALRWAPIESDEAGQELVAALDDLRHGEAEQRALGTEAAAASPALSRLRRRVVDLSRASGTRLASGASETGVGTLAADETALTFVENGGQLLRVTQSAASTELADLGPASDITQLARDLALAERQLARRAGMSDRVAEAAAERHRQLTQSMADLLLPEQLGNRIFVNPSAALHGVSWGALPGLFERDHVVCPSVAISRRSRSGSSGRAMVCAASELAHAPIEAEAIGAIHGVEAVIDPAASATAAIAESDLLHVAGHFRQDGANPLFSHVQLGPLDLCGYDFLAMHRSPQVVVLSSCSSAATDDRSDGPFGFATALLAAGTSTVIASQAPLEDGDALVALMTSIHRDLSLGAAPAEAVRAARLGAPVDDYALAGSIVVLGNGW